MGGLSDARTRLHGAITGVFDEPVGGYAFTGRVDEFQPLKAAPPRVFIGDSAGARVQANGTKYVGAFPVYVVIDGTIAKQVAGVDEIVSRIHDAAVNAGFDVTDHAPSPLPPELFASAPANVRTAVVTVEATVRGLTLCTPTHS